VTPIFSGGGGGEESATISSWSSRRTNRPAIDAGCRYPYVQHAIESRIARDQSFITTVVIEQHTAFLSHHNSDVWRFSDMYAGDWK
jgi:hypothetical protein